MDRKPASQGEGLKILLRPSQNLRLVERCPCPTHPALLLSYCRTRLDPSGTSTTSTGNALGHKSLISKRGTNNLNGYTAMSSDPAMDCPRCQTRNPVGALTCSKCRSPLGGDAPTLVGELTPPPESSGVTLYIGPATPSASAEGETLDVSAASSMAIPCAWSVPAP